MSSMSPQSNPCIISRSPRSGQYAREACFSIARQILVNIDAEYIAAMGIISKSTLT